MKCKRCGREYEMWTDEIGLCPECYAEVNFTKFWRGIPKAKQVKLIGELFESAKEFYDRYGRGRSYIYGDTGTGKTIIACNILLAKRLITFAELFVEKGRFIPNPEVLMGIGRFVSCPQLEFTVKTRLDQASGLLEEVAYTMPILILDDFGRGSFKKSDYVLDFWFSLLDIRERNHMQTVFTSEKSLDELRELYGEAIPSRIYEIVEGNVYLKRGEDRRLKESCNDE